jgi:hypothetical protein
MAKRVSGQHKTFGFFSAAIGSRNEPRGAPLEARTKPKKASFRE